MHNDVKWSVQHKMHGGNFSVNLGFYVPRLDKAEFYVAQGRGLTELRQNSRMSAKSKYRGFRLQLRIFNSIPLLVVVVVGMVLL